MHFQARNVAKSTTQTALGETTELPRPRAGFRRRQRKTENKDGKGKETWEREKMRGMGKLVPSAQRGRDAQLMICQTVRVYVYWSKFINVKGGRACMGKCFTLDVQSLSLTIRPKFFFFCGFFPLS